MKIILTSCWGILAQLPRVLRGRGFESRHGGLGVVHRIAIFVFVLDFGQVLKLGSSFGQALKLGSSCRYIKQVGLSQQFSHLVMEFPTQFINVNNPMS
jgi:hypothetical protein